MVVWRFPGAEGWLVFRDFIYKFVLFFLIDDFDVEAFI
jgi:hypothetical protein